MILYFSGTGNSRFVAHEIAKQLDDEVVSLNECMRTQAPRQFDSAKPYVVVCPIYVSRMPLEVESYLKSCTFSGNTDIWFVVTCGGGMGGTGHYCKKIADSKGLVYHGTACLIMPNNYVAFSSVVSSEEGKQKAHDLLPAIQEIALHISKGEQLTADKKLTTMAWVSGMAEFFHVLLMKDKPFTVNNNCIGCRRCEKSCPMNNIIIKDGRPTWNGKCMQCMACIGVCPVKAIDYGNKTQQRNRYYLDEV